MLNGTAAPLASAALRLRKPPGRPKKARDPEHTPSTPAPQRADSEKEIYRALEYKSTAPTVRLLGIRAAGVYLGVGPTTVRNLVASGAVSPVRIPGAAGDCRRVLLDRLDLDALIAIWKGA